MLERWRKVEADKGSGRFCIGDPTVREHAKQASSGHASLIRVHATTQAHTSRFAADCLAFVTRLVGQQCQQDLRQRFKVVPQQRLPHQQLQIERVLLLRLRGLQAWPNVEHEWYSVGEVCLAVPLISDILATLRLAVRLSHTLTLCPTLAHLYEGAIRLRPAQVMLEQVRSAVVAGAPVQAVPCERTAADICRGVELNGQHATSKG